jgi:hypothetical protein
MSKKEFFWGVVVVIAGVILAGYVAPWANRILGGILPGSNQA